MGGGAMDDAATGPFRGAPCGEVADGAGCATCAARAMIGVSDGGRILAMTCTAPDPPPIGCPPGGPSVPGGADIAVGSSIVVTTCLVVDLDLTIRISSELK